MSATKITIGSILKMAGVLVLALAAFQTAHALDVTVNPGGNIQAALDQVGNAGGGTVYVNYGTYNISATLLMPNNTRLKGVTTRPIIKMASGANKTVIKSKANNFRTLTCDFLAINGGQSNAQLDAGLYQTANGIDWGGGYWKTNAYIYNCNVVSAAQGIVIGRAKNVILQGANISNNGAGDGLLHNVYISICDPVRASNVNSSYARYGMGFKLTDAYNDQNETSQIVENCTFNNNAGRGTAIYDIGNLTFRNNYCDNNGVTHAQSGINMIRCHDFTMTGNHATGNGYEENVAYDIWLNGCWSFTQSGNVYNTKKGF